MIECRIYKQKPRDVDGKNVCIRTSSSYVEIETHHIFAEIPEGRVESEFADTLSGCVRCDQTGAVYEIAHDVEDAPYTYTEVFPNPRQLSEITFSSVVGGATARLNTKPYPDYKSNATYAKGDRVISSLYGNERVYESDFDDNTGNPPNLYGWTMIMPFLEDYPEPEFVTIEEFNAIIDEMAAEEQAEGGEG